MQVVQTHQFEKAYKKLHKNQLVDANKAIQDVMMNPLIGTQKRGDLSDVRVYKFQMVNQLTLLAYSYEEGRLVLTFMALGPHENFYRNLKR